MSLSQLMANAGIGNESAKRSQSTAKAATGRVALVESQLVVSQAEAKVNAMEAVFSAVAESQSRLEAIVSGINVASEGLTKREAAIINTQVAAYNATTIPEFQVKFPSNESFDGAGRVAQTRLSNEVVVDKAKQLGAWIKEQIVKLIEFVQKWIDAVFGSAERLLKYAEALEARLAKVEIKDPKRKINIPTLILSSGTTVPTNSTVAGTIGDVAGTIPALVSENALVKDYLDACMEAAKTEAKDIEAEVADAGKFGIAKAKYASEASPVEEAKAVGGKYIKVEEGKRNVTSLTAKMAKDSVEVEIISVADCAKILANVIKVTGVVIDSRKKYGDKSKLANEVKSAGDDIAKAKDDKETTSPQKTAYGEVTTALTNMAKATVKGTAQDWTAHMISVCAAATKAVDASLK
jgi:hypothetical protein